MTERKILDEKLIKLGNIIRERREDLQYSSRVAFIEDVVDTNLLPEGWISEKTLTNIEGGYNLPSLNTLKNLSIALQVDFEDLVREIEDYI